MTTDGSAREPVSVLVFSASLRAGSLNTQLARLAVTALEATGVEVADGLVIASPEYNASMPGVLKNMIDWSSRRRPQPFHQKHCLLLSASPSMVGGNRGLWATRMPLEHLGTRVYPDMFSLAQAHDALDDDGTIKLKVLQERFEQTISNWSDQVEASKHYPCAKARWVEFLGEQPTPALDRVQ